MSKKKNCAGLDLDIVACPDGRRTAVQNADGMAFAPAFESAGYTSQTSTGDEDRDASFWVTHDLKVNFSFDRVLDPFFIRFVVLGLGITVDGDTVGVVAIDRLVGSSRTIGMRFVHVSKLHVQNNGKED